MLGQPNSGLAKCLSTAASAGRKFQKKVQFLKLFDLRGWNVDAHPVKLSPESGHDPEGFLLQARTRRWDQVLREVPLDRPGPNVIKLFSSTMLLHSFQDGVLVPGKT